MWDKWERGAIISDCGTFRYRLWRTWDRALPQLPFIMLNPSTADGNTDDPTVRKICNFAKQFGYGGIEVGNLYAYRATKPAELLKTANPIGPNNDNYLKALATCYGPLVICAWGVTTPARWHRATDVLQLLGDHGARPHALALTAEDDPWHPLYLSYNMPDGTPRQPIPYTP